MTTQQIIEDISAMKTRSAWEKARKTYALELLEDLGESFTRKELLNGASNWREFSNGGCSLIYDADIAERLCSASALKRTKDGERAPNSMETWLDCQARCLSQASTLILSKVTK